MNHPQPPQNVVWYPQGAQQFPPVPPQQYLTLVPQSPYDAQSSRRNISPPVEFWDAGSGMLGISLAEAEDGNLQTSLRDPDTQPLHDQVGQKLSYRLQFIGCDPFSKQKYSRTTGRDAPVTRAKMAKQVAEVVKAFLQERGRFILKLADGTPWGPADGLTMNDLYLTRVFHVTTGSLQPEICFDNRRGYLMPVVPTMTPGHNINIIQYAQ